VKEAYNKDGPGRPPRKPMGFFRALMVKRLQQLPSERELCWRLWKDDNLRELCDIEAEQNPYHPSRTLDIRDSLGSCLEGFEMTCSNLMLSLRPKM